MRSLNLQQNTRIDKAGETAPWEDGTAATAPDCKSGIPHGGSSPPPPTEPGTWLNEPLYKSILICKSSRVGRLGDTEL